MTQSPISNTATATESPHLAARDRILATATDLFFRRGIHATGVDMLIEEAGVAKSTFYRHFPSKDALIVAWLRSAGARWIDTVSGALEDAPPLRALLDFWDRLADWAEGCGYLGCPYLKALAEIDEPHPALVEVENFVNEVDTYFIRTTAAAGFQNPEEIGIRLRLLTMGALMAIMLERTRRPLERARDVTVDLLASWRGLSRSEMEKLIANS